MCTAALRILSMYVAGTRLSIFCGTEAATLGGAERRVEKYACGDRARRWVGGGWEAYERVGKGRGTDCTWDCLDILRSKIACPICVMVLFVLRFLVSDTFSFSRFVNRLRLDGYVFMKIVCMPLVAE